MKKSTWVTCLLLITLVFFFRPRSIESVILDKNMDGIQIVSIKKIDKGNFEVIHLEDYDTAAIVTDIGGMDIMPYPWGRDMEVEADKPYYIIRVLVNDQEIFIDVYSNQIGIGSNNYWVWKKELLTFELDSYKYE